LLIICAGPAFAEPPPFGLWLVENGEGAIEILPCPDTAALCGRLVWMKPDSNPPPLDRHNPDPAKRNHPICGLMLMTGFNQDATGAWKGGDLYNPEDGHRYPAIIRRDGPDLLKLRGYVLIPLLGQTQTWRRAPPDLGRCAS
jgi:uncharacterized protein (DUF2147 family)